MAFFLLPALVVLLLKLQVVRALPPWSEEDWPLCGAGSGCVNLHFLWTAELRGKFFPVTSSGATCDPADADSCYGGHARRAAFVEDFRNETSYRSEKAFLLDLGGTAFGGPVWGHDDYAQGMPSTMMQNALPYDYCLLSSSDFLIDSNEDAISEYPQSLLERDCPLLLSSLTFGGAFAGLNQLAVQYSVETLSDGSKVGLVGMMQNELDANQGFPSNVFTIDKNNRYNTMLNGSEQVLSITASELAELGEAYTEDQWNIFVLASETPTGVTAAVEAMQREHPDLDSMILLSGNGVREDQIHWVVNNLPFDAIIVANRLSASESDPVMYTSPSNRSVLVAHSRTTYGLGSLSLRISAEKGVQKYEFVYDSELDASVGQNETVYDLMDTLYQAVRERNSQVFGSLDNPLTGGHRTGETAPSMYQCYYMDCPAADHIGRGMLWKAQDLGYEPHVSFANLGGFRAALLGNDDGEVYLDHCISTLAFQNTLKLYEILGKDLYDMITSFILDGEPGFIGAGVRVAIHQPCWDFIDHSNYIRSDAGSTGTEEELAACMASGIEDTTMTIVDMQIKAVGGNCDEGDDECEEGLWSRIEKGATYTLVASGYMASVFGTFTDLGIDLGSESMILCEYIAANQPLGVESWSAYDERGTVRYETAAEGWLTGARLVEVVPNVAYVDADATCPDGKYLPDGAYSCVVCPMGTHSSTSSARDSCIDCSRGFYGDQEGLSECTACPAGTYTDEAGRTDCSACEAGAWSILGSSSCFPCQAGFYTDTLGSETCTACPIGTYAESMQSTSCDSCPHSLSTDEKSATSSSECVCPEGTYRPAADSLRSTCVPCPEGMECAFGADALNIEFFAALIASTSNVTYDEDGERPLLEAGYMSMPESPLKVYKCLTKTACPGGKEGTCGDWFDPTAVACGRCMDGAYKADEKCEECSGTGKLPIILAIFLGICAVGCVVVFASRDVHKKTRLASFMTIVAGLQLSMLQITGVFYNLDFIMLEPLRSMCSSASILAFDMRVLQMECMFGSNPVGSFLWRNLIFPICLPIVLVSLIFKKRRQPDLNVSVAFTNAVGTVFVAIYISLIVGCAVPVLCYQHVGGNGWSMTNHPSILCYTSGDYEPMLAIGILSFCFVPLPFTVVMAWAACRHPYAMAHYSEERNALQVERFRFLWQRFKPDCHYYTMVLLARSFLIGFVPVLAADDTVLQIGLFYAVLGTFVLCQAGLRPWRYEEANWIDLFGNLVLLCLLLCAGLTAGVSDYSSNNTIRGLVTTCSVILILVLVLAFLIVIRKFIGNRGRFDKLLCHHKGDAAAQARLLLMLFKAEGVRNVFLDSDNMFDLDSLFDIVKTQVDELVVVLTGQLLSRPWCVGEIVMAFVTHNRLFKIICDDFTPVVLDSVGDVQLLLDESICRLGNYNINYEMVLKALRNFLYMNERSVKMSITEGSICYQRVAAEIVGSQKSVKTNKSGASLENLQLDESSVLISACRQEPEAVASAEVIIRFLEANPENRDFNVIRLYDLTRGATPLSQIMPPLSALVLVLSKGSLQDAEQLSTIEDGIDAKVTTGIRLVHVSLPDFSLPRMDYYEKLLPQIQPIDTEYLAQQLDTLFKQVSYQLPIHASEEAIRYGCEMIRQRLSYQTGRESKAPRPTEVFFASRPSQLQGRLVSVDALPQPTARSRPEEASPSSNSPRPSEWADAPQTTISVTRLPPKIVDI